MDLLEIIKSRRSIRKFLSRKVEDEDIKKILEAGIWAPSGLNNQPWKFKIIKESVLKIALAKYTVYSDIIKYADTIICVFLDKNSSYNRVKDLQAIGACIQNMILEAYSLGLGSCWIGEVLNRREKAEKMLNIDSSLELMAVIALGYPGESPDITARKSLRNVMIK